jgi:decaprenylphospho-beta-D-erythro-pentofuranosid-2-ulose 2-reductase
MERVLILGATSAIAQRVVALHDARGDRLHLVGRSPEKLAALVAGLPPARVTTEQADFGELEQLEGLVERGIAKLGGLDRVLIAHGDLGDQLASERSFQAAEAILRNNLLSVIALLVPLANHLEQARGGRLGVITSVAGERGRPRNYTYGAAKGAVNIYLQGLRSRLFASGVSVTTLKLGPVDTPMTREHKKTLLFAKADPVAASIVAAMDARVAEAYVPFFWGAIMPVVKATPERLFQKLGFLSGR